MLRERTRAIGHTAPVVYTVHDVEPQQACMVQFTAPCCRIHAAPRQIVLQYARDNALVDMVLVLKVHRADGTVQENPICTPSEAARMRLRNVCVDTGYVSIMLSIVHLSSLSMQT